MSTVWNADMIFVLNKGKVVEHGSHVELMARKKRYYELFTVSMKSQS